MRQQDKLVHENHDGSGIGRHMTQLMEHYIKLTKNHCRRNCNHKPDWMIRLFHFLDCVTIGTVGYDLVDFQNCHREFIEQHKMIYDPTTTPMVESILIRQMPLKYFKVWEAVHSIKFRGNISDSIKRVWNQHLLNHDDLNKMNVYLQEISNINAINDDLSWYEGSDDESGTTNLEERIDKMRNNLTRKQILEMMQKNTMEQNPFDCD